MLEHQTGKREIKEDKAKDFNLEMKWLSLHWSSPKSMLGMPPLDLFSGIRDEILARD